MKLKFIASFNRFKSVRKDFISQIKCYEMDLMNTEYFQPSFLKCVLNKIYHQTQCFLTYLMLYHIKWKRKCEVRFCHVIAASYVDNTEQSKTLMINIKYVAILVFNSVYPWFHNFRNCAECSFVIINIMVLIVPHPRL